MTDSVLFTILSLLLFKKHLKLLMPELQLYFKRMIAVHLFLSRKTEKFHSRRSVDLPEGAADGAADGVAVVGACVVPAASGAPRS